MPPANPGRKETGTQAPGRSLSDQCSIGGGDEPARCAPHAPGAGARERVIPQLPAAAFFLVFRPLRVLLLACGNPGGVPLLACGNPGALPLLACGTPGALPLLPCGAPGAAAPGVVAPDARASCAAPNAGAPRAPTTPGAFDAEGLGVAAVAG